MPGSTMPAKSSAAAPSVSAASLPSVTMMPSLGPFLWSSMFVATVLDSRMTDVRARSEGVSKAAIAASSSTQRRKHSVKSWGVVSTLVHRTPAPPLRTPSVNVPPMSTSMV